MLVDTPPLTVLNIHKSYGRHTVLRGISFSLSAGTLVGIVGENGSGKSTLLRILAGELKPSGGEVYRHGSLGYCPQTVIVNDALTVQQHLDYFRAAYDLAGLGRANELLHRLNYAQYRNATVGTLSGGTKQKLNLTIAAMHDPDVLLLDEPYQGFDWETYLHFWDLAEEMRDRGHTVLVISHLIFDETRFDEIYQLADGRICPRAVAAEVLR